MESPHQKEASLVQDRLKILKVHLNLDHMLTILEILILSLDLSKLKECLIVELPIPNLPIRIITMETQGLIHTLII